MAGGRHIIHPNNIIFRDHVSYTCAIIAHVRLELIEHKAVVGVAQKFDLS